jgi:cell division inhibitor SulA/protein ImuA
MSRESRLQNILQNPRVWVAGRSAAGVFKPVPTGFAALDRKLGGGWPVGALTEFLLREHGIGELRCLMPALAGLSRQAGPEVGSDGNWIAWIAPPHIPYAPALAQHGVDISRLLIAQADAAIDVLWATEQILRSPACVAALAWIADADDRALRRLQLAAEAGRCCAIIFRHARYLRRSSPAVLRIQFKYAAGSTMLNVIRNRYGRPGVIRLSCD